MIITLVKGQKAPVKTGALHDSRNFYVLRVATQHYLAYAFGA